MNDSYHTCSVPKDMEVMVCSSRMLAKDLLVIVSCSCLSNNEPLVMVSSSVLSYSDKPVMVCSSCLSRKAFSCSFFCRQNHFDHYLLRANTLGNYSTVKYPSQHGIIPSIDIITFIVFVNTDEFSPCIKKSRHKFLINYQINL